VFAQHENDNTAILFIGAKGTPYQGEPICKATVNGYTALSNTIFSKGGKEKRC